MITQQLFSLNWADFAIIFVVVISALISLSRGFIKEAISLVAWIVGFWMALHYYSLFAEALHPYIKSHSLASTISFVVIFLVIVIFGAMFNYFFSLLLVKTGLNGTDRVLGMVFGVARGVLLVAVVILLISTTVYSQNSWWKSSVLIPHFQPVIIWLKGLIPQKFNYLSHAPK